MRWLSARSSNLAVCQTDCGVERSRRAQMQRRLFHASRFDFGARSGSEGQIVVLAGEGWRSWPAPDVTSDNLTPGGSWSRPRSPRSPRSPHRSTHLQLDGTRARRPGWARAAVRMWVVLVMQLVHRHCCSLRERCSAVVLRHGPQTCFPVIVARMGVVGSSRHGEFPYIEPNRSIKVSTLDMLDADCLQTALCSHHWCYGLREALRAAA